VDLADHPAADEADADWSIGGHHHSFARARRGAEQGGRYRDDVPPRPTATINNRRARHDYLILDTYEAGIVLKGAEVKSIREGRATLSEAYARVENGEVWLYGMHIQPYPYSRDELDPLRRRKLLLHHKQIGELARATDEKGVTLVPLKCYFKDGRAKLELAIGRGKRSYDKRHAIAERDAKREAQRALKERNRGE
jgi:SsrA-binding protein